MENKNELNQLQKKLDILLAKHQSFALEIKQVKDEVARLRYAQETPPITPPKPKVTPPPKKEYEELFPRKSLAPDPPKENQPITPTQNPDRKDILPEVDFFNIEKFIGENLINKIGIFITIIGVIIGAKYSIENNLVSPLTRIILGYLLGIGLLGFGIRLKEKYLNYSAVLVSGSIAILYFITFAAYDFYGLIPQLFAFGLMVIFTVFTVIAALHYNKQVIAHIGLVGAYAVPFLLSSGSGNVVALFTYMSIINVGILLISFRKYWKSLFYLASTWTWLIVIVWYFDGYRMSQHFATALIFNTIFFITFYITFLAYKLTQKGNLQKGETLIILFNSFIFYGLGYWVLANHPTGEQLLGLFTLGNGIIHFAVSVLIYQRKLANQQLLYLISGLVLIFLTAAIPVQLDGNWVTILWTAEAAVLFWVGRTKQIPIYERLAYPIIFLAFGSLLDDWSNYNNYSLSYPERRITPLLNINFLTSVLFIAAFSFINYINSNKNYPSPLADSTGIKKMLSFAIPAICLFTVFYAFHLEIITYWEQLFKDSALSVEEEGYDYKRKIYNQDIPHLQSVWLINYAMTFFTILTFINIKKLKSPILSWINIALSLLSLVAFLGPSLFILSELRESYLVQSQAEYYPRSSFNLWFRYICFVFVGGLLFSLKTYTRKVFTEKIYSNVFEIILFGTILWLASSELIHWMDIGAKTKSYKIELSIFWGVYALLLVGLGIWKRKKHLRLGAMVLFGGTLVKLFFYDIAHLNTISKTIVLVSLGVLLLIISFLYNKYQHEISDESEA